MVSIQHKKAIYPVTVVRWALLSRLTVIMQKKHAAQLSHIDALFCYKNGGMTSGNSIIVVICRLNIMSIRRTVRNRLRSGILITSLLPFALNPSKGEGLSPERRPGLKTGSFSGTTLQRL